MIREHLEQTPEQHNTPDTHELDSLLTDIRAAQKQLEQRSGTDNTELQHQLAEVKDEVVRFQENKEIIGNKNDLEQLKQRVQTIRQQVEIQTVAGNIQQPDTQELLIAADKGRAAQASAVVNSLQNPQSGVGILDGIMKRFGDRV